MPTDWLSAQRKMMMPGMAPSAGQPSMGGGPMPYAPGSTNWQPQTTPPPQQVQPAQSPGFGQASAQGQQQGQGQGVGQGGSPPGFGQQGGMGPQMPNPQLDQSIAYARALVERLKAEILRSRQAGRTPGRMF